MTLGFTTSIDGIPNYFVEKIWQSFFETPGRAWSKMYDTYLMKHKSAFGKEWDIHETKDLRPKIHTVRKDKNCRWKAGMDIHFVIHNRTPERFQFAPVVKSLGVQDIQLYKTEHSVNTVFNVIIDGKALSKKEIEQFAWNDGFESSADLFNYFNQPFKGRLIHWTNLKY